MWIFRPVNDNQVHTNKFEFNNGLSTLYIHISVIHHYLKYRCGGEKCIKSAH